ncbi:MAG: Crp/Fnr family transcriptional regulator [Rhizobacter sp.]|nr:Crp/Fnr family transcriptional regulator [Ferruginibacter sp.]
MQSPLLLLQSISKYIQLTTEEENFFLSLLQPKKIRKKQLLTQEGDINQSAKFVLSGLLRMYSVDKNGFEHIIQFAPAGWWIGDLYSYHKQQPGNLFIDAIEDTEIVEISRNSIDILFEKIPKFERFFRILAENALAAYQQRLSSNLNLPAKDRYGYFVELYPSLFLSLPQKYIASYIGVTPEFLSKMLNQPASKK